MLLVSSSNDHLSTGPGGSGDGASVGDGNVEGHPLGAIEGDDGATVLSQHAKNVPIGSGQQSRPLVSPCATHSGCTLQSASTVGDDVGDLDGTMLGISDGLDEGDAEGDWDGAFVGSVAAVGTFVGVVGHAEGLAVGLAVVLVGLAEGEADGDTLGSALGASVLSQHSKNVPVPVSVQSASPAHEPRLRS